MLSRFWLSSSRISLIICISCASLKDFQLLQDGEMEEGIHKIQVDVTELFSSVFAIILIR
ncbi:unnamed protein product [Arabidopsis thaliana]|uniref:Uncharacterized protein n=1 Tax=Arabidopsis thaliana TaxID=3702 RepID=A0A654FRP9_ARATH|nr:unnamed protein product [Arabidopsis thaliana]VYS63393.1 unnamed protein product [Arabidopsis thaliana]